MPRKVRTVLLLTLLGSAAAVSPASAADSIYWANSNSNTIAFARLDGTGGGNLATGAATKNAPQGVAIDSASGRIYWANSGANKISFARLDGGGGGDLPIGTAPVALPRGVAIDPVGRRIYWVNGSTDTISFARLDGGGGAQFAPGAATTSGLWALAADPTSGLLWWSNSATDGLAFARLDGTGGANFTPGAGPTYNRQRGIAVDRSAGRLWWTNTDPVEKGISFARLDGTGGGADLPTGTATVDEPRTLAVDAAGGRVYWANFQASKIGFARMDGTGGADLPTGAAGLSFPYGLAVLRRPVAAGAPALTGGTKTGTTLTCSRGGWAGDLPEAFLYRAPNAFAFAWSRNGTDIAGATGATLKPTQGGDYRCRVTASNTAGGTAQTSAVLTVSGGGSFGKKTRVSLKLAGAVAGSGPLRVTIANANAFTVAGKVGAATTKAVTVSKKRRLKLKSKSFSVRAGKKKTVKLKLTKALRALLRKKGKVALRLTATVRDPAGTKRTVKKKVTMKLKRRKPKR